MELIWQIQEKLKKNKFEIKKGAFLNDTFIMSDPVFKSNLIANLA